MSSSELPLGHIGADDPELRGGGAEKTTKDRNNLVLFVSAPNDPDSKPFRFPSDTTVGDAARQAATTFGYDSQGTPSFRLVDGTVLDRTATLVAAGLEHRDEVELVDVGGGV